MSKRKFRLNRSRRWNHVDRFERLEPRNLLATFCSANVVDMNALVARDVIRSELGSNGDLDGIGGRSFGEGEGFDFGDAGVPYPTLLAENGARHAAVGLQLGPTRDAEPDGTHGTWSDQPDEDGIQLNFFRAGNSFNQIRVDVAGGDGKLDVWIDFNQDGSWGGPDEQVFVSADVTEGLNYLDFQIPITATEGITEARFRLSSAGGLGYVGPAADGEVEDYIAFINAPREATGEFYAENVITDSGSAMANAVASDIDGDFQMDVVSVSDSGEVVWHEGNFGSIVNSTTVSTPLAGATSVFVADLDRDGDGDILSASAGTNKIEWYEFDNGNFVTHPVANTLNVSASRLFVADMDNDSDLDIVATSFEDNVVMWYQNDGNQQFTEFSIDQLVTQPTEVRAADVDNDGDMDVLAALGGENRVVWYENDGDQGFTQHVITDQAQSPNSIFTSDVDLDGDLDVLSASQDDDRVAWYENDGSQNFTTHVVGTTGVGASSVMAADVDGDGNVDVVAGSSDGQIVFYDNDGQENFSPRVASQQSGGIVSVYLTEMEGDHDLDVLYTTTDGMVAFLAQNQNPRILSDTMEDVPEDSQYVQDLRDFDLDIPRQTRTMVITGLGEDNDKFEIVNDDELQFIVAPDFENPTDLGGTPGDNIYHVSVEIYDGVGGVGFHSLEVTVTDVLSTDVVARNIFYNDSGFDGSNDFDAVATDKTPLLFGQVATFENYSSSITGITGVMVSVVDLAETPTLSTIGDFFDFKIGNDDTPQNWVDAPMPTAVSFEEDVEGTGVDRIALTWDDADIRNTWLQVTMLANSNTGLTTSDSFFFGNAPGETGNDPANAIVNLVDVGLARNNQTAFGTADIENVFDFDRDGRVNLVDVALARANQSAFTPLRLIDLTDASGRPSVGGETNGKITNGFDVNSLLRETSGIYIGNLFAPTREFNWKEIKPRENDPDRFERLSTFSPQAFDALDLHGESKLASKSSTELASKEILDEAIKSIHSELADQFAESLLETQVNI